MMPTTTPARRLWVFYIPYVILAVGMGVALLLVSRAASDQELSAERSARLRQDCQARVEARDVLRDVVMQAYTVPAGYPPDVAARAAARRDAVLKRVPELKCETAAGIPIPEPVSTSPASTTNTSARGEPVA